MRSSRLLFAITATALLYAASASAAAGIDMDDPRRALALEGDIRIDAQVIQETVSPGTPIGVTYQIENRGTAAVAVADRVAAASYDSDSQTITLAIGSEVPQDGRMPHVVTIEPGQKKVLRAGATPSLNAAMFRTSASAPRFVQVKVSILRDLGPFADVIDSHAPQGTSLTDDQFEKWFESNDTIFLNSVPVRFSPRRVTGRAGYSAADHRDPGASF